MTRRSKIWLAVAALFTALNLAGAVVAAMQVEVIHSAMHVGLMLLGGYFVWRIIAVPGRGAPSGELTDRLTQLEQSVDAVAIEIERIGEGQRFITHRFIEDHPPASPGEGAAEPIEIKPREAAPNVRRD